MWLEEFIERTQKEARKHNLVVGKFKLSAGPTYKDAELWLGRFITHEHDRCILNALAAVERYWNRYWSAHPRATWIRILFPCLNNPEQKTGADGSTTFTNLLAGQTYKITAGDLGGILICNREREFRLCGCTDTTSSPFIEIDGRGEIKRCDERMRYEI